MTSSDSLLELSEESPSSSALDNESWSLDERHLAGRARGCKKSGVIWQGARVPIQIPKLWSVTPWVEFLGSPMKIAMLGSGTQAAQRIASLAAEGKLVWIAVRIWTFLSCTWRSFSFCRRRSFRF